MSDQDLNESKSSDTSVKSQEEVKKRLSRGGLTRYYEDKSGLLILEKSDAVRVGIQYLNGKVIIKQKFPQIGNSVQIIASIILLVVTFFLPIPSILLWVIAIIGGQFISYYYYSPKCKALQEEVEGLMK